MMNQRPPLPDARSKKTFARQLQDVVEVVQLLSQAKELPSIVEIVKREARRLTGADGATLVLLEDETCHYVDEDAIGPLWKGARFPKERCVSGWAIEQGQPVLIRDVNADPRVPAGVYEPTFVTSVLIVPIRPADPLGAIGNYWANEHEPTEDEIHLLRALANATAVALENVHRYADLERRVHERTKALEHEISERRQVEAMLRDSQQRFAGIVESAMDAIISIDQTQRIVFFNAAAEVMFGYPAARMIGQPVDCLIPPRVRAGHAAKVRQFLASGATARAMGALQPLQGLRADGEDFPIEATISKIDLAGGPLATVIVRDISQRVQAERALAASEARLRYVTEAAEIGHWDWDIGADRLEWSERCKAIFGMEDHEPASYARFLQGIHPEDRAHVDAAVQAALAGSGEFDLEFRVLAPDGQVRWAHSKGAASFDTDGRAQRMGGVVLDVTARKEMETALRESEARFRNMADTAPAMLWVTEPDGSCSFLSRGWYEFTGQTEATGLGFGWLDAVHPADREATAAAFRTASGEQKVFSSEHRLLRADRVYRWVLDTGRPRRAPDGRFLGYIGSVIDITERKQAEEAMRQRSLHDPLTNLPNRALTLELSEHLLAASQRGEIQSAVLFIDLDRFKPINDSYGHHVGDIVLKEVANRLRRSVRREDVVGRQGGDEFLAVLSHIHTQDEAAHAATHILTCLSAPYRVFLANQTRPLELETSPSIGISLYPDDGTDIAQLIERADSAMYRAKAAGCGTYRFYGDGN